MSSASHFQRSLNLNLKEAKPFQIELQRGNKKQVMSYQSSPQGNGKYKLQILNKPSSRRLASSQASQSLPSTQKNLPKKQSINKSPVKKKSLVPENLKSHVQRAYVSRSNSFVYSDYNFDAPQIQALPIGKNILISRKVFLPAHGFGSFYRVFLFHKEKKIGYISEAEIITEFIKKDGEYIPNANYKKAKLYKQRKQVLKIEEIEDTIPKDKKIATQKETRKKLLQTVFKKYAGLSLRYSPYLNNASSFGKNSFVGLKLSTYSSRIHLDFNADFYPSLDLSSSLLLGLPLVKSVRYSIFLLGGGSIDFPLYRNTHYWDKMDFFAIVGGFSLVAPLNQKMILKVEPQTLYNFNDQTVALRMLLAIQYSF